MMVGLPASGKSTIAKEIEKSILLSSDNLREKLFGDINNQDGNDIVFETLHKLIKYYLLKGISVVYDATNINYKQRMELLKGLRNIDCYKQCILVATPYEKCLHQNSQRERQVPSYIIEKMYKNFYIPEYYEGWDDIHIIYNDDGYKFDIHELFNGENGLNFIGQDNPNHTLTIGKHCLESYSLCEKYNGNILLCEAALLHDIGKRFTKEFKNSKGEDTDIAHYYQHHLVSAYDSLFYCKDFNLNDRLTIANYIQWHMQPFFLESDKAKKKFINLVGKEFYNDIMILHEADKNAK
jgi:predicted kinase/predicted HD phosphohydrolase